METETTGVTELVEFEFELMEVLEAVLEVELDGREVAEAEEGELVDWAWTLNGRRMRVVVARSMLDRSMLREFKGENVGY